MVIGKVRFTKNRARFRVRSPTVFSKGSFRTIREPKGMELIVGRLKGKRVMRVQSVSIPKEAYRKDKRVHVNRRKHSFWVSG